MKKIISLLITISLLACSENLLEKPDNLIPEDTMVEVLTDLAVVNAARSTNISVLRNNGIEPMAYIYKKHGIDSTQFVESDRYYASLPEKYEQIYKKVETRLEKQTKVLEAEKKVKDSLRQAELENRGDKTNLEKIKDSLP
ncbi:MAG TPA: DUF4296 domain-containing protein [Pricia sp.]|nr:DUF4296 domain-containing protein [Pricia sp.]